MVIPRQDSELKAVEEACREASRTAEPWNGLNDWNCPPPSGAGMIIIFLERLSRNSALVVLLRGAPCDEPPAVSNHVWTRAFDKMIM